jgi:hypothetical protein
MELKKIRAYKVTRTPRSSSGTVKYNAETYAVYDDETEAAKVVDDLREVFLNAEINLIAITTWSR